MEKEVLGNIVVKNEDEELKEYWVNHFFRGIATT